MAKYADNDPYIDPKTGILKNRLGIKDQNTLGRVEATFATARAFEMVRKPVQGNFDLAHMQAIHKKLFGDVYAWAGQLRTVDISKGDTRFAHHGLIASYAPQITKQLAREQHLRGLEPEPFSRRAGHYWGELNVLHPFREGNGRTLREFIGQLAHQAGYQVQWSKMERDDITRGSIEAYSGNSARLGELIRASLIDRDRDRAAELARNAGGITVRIERAEAGQSYRGRVIGSTERYIVQEREDKPGAMVLHNRRSIDAKAADLRGRTVAIDYPHGSAGLVREAGQGREHRAGTERDRTRDGDRDRER